MVAQHDKRGVCFPKGRRSGGISFTRFLSLLLRGARMIGEHCATILASALLLRADGRGRF